MMIAACAVVGLGPASFLPTGMMLLGETCGPGPGKNIIYC